MRVGQAQSDRRINLTGNYLSASIIGNFGAATQSVNPNFQFAGQWYDYFSGDTLVVTNKEAPIELEPGEFRIYTNIKMETPIIIDTDVSQPETSQPREFALHQNYPNPFNPATEIRYSLPTVAQAKLEIYNVLGEKIRTLIDRKQSDGAYAVNWDGRDDRGERVSSGVYLYRLQTDQAVQTRKMLLVH